MKVSLVIMAAGLGSRCGETAAENMMHLQGEEILCRDCYSAYDRFHV